jgi:hypothetical protein
LLEAFFEVMDPRVKPAGDGGTLVALRCARDMFTQPPA